MTNVQPKIVANPASREGPMSSTAVPVVGPSRAPDPASEPPETACPPMGLGLSLLYFGIPAAVFSASILGLLPWMMRRGVAPLVIFNVTFGGPLALMLAAALVAVRREGQAGSWAALRRRMRLEPMGPSGWAWTAALCAFALLPFSLVAWMRPWLVQVHLYTRPDEFSRFMGMFTGGAHVFLGIPLAGQWWVLAYYIAMLMVLNIGGEELWWRGYILPRQERALGAWAWVVNGTLWAAFHIFYHSTLYSFAAQLPGTLAVAFVCQRTRSTWPGIIGHTVMNAGVPLMLFRGIAS
jgi:membrane protease YdiL (CAAX protease family)